MSQPKIILSKQDFSELVEILESRPPLLRECPQMDVWAWWDEYKASIPISVRTDPEKAQMLGPSDPPVVPL
jgi:hypothetical protein